MLKFIPNAVFKVPHQDTPLGYPSFSSDPLSPLESFLLTLVRLRRNFYIFHISYLFQVSEATVTNTILTWINFIPLNLGSLCTWPTREQVKAVIPKSMKEKFPNVPCIIDCVEFKIAVPASLVMHKVMYSAKTLGHKSMESSFYIWLARNSRGWSQNATDLIDS